MARTKREWNPRMFNHVVMRGNNRQDIFKDKADVAEFFRVLHYSYMKHPFTLSAYCIMTNHYHLLIRSPEAPLGKVMALINRRYSDYYKKKYNYSGYLYGSRYFAQKAESPTSILTISRYIHRNPIETTIPMVNRMEEYPYSSYAFYYRGSPSPYPFLELDLLPSLLPSRYGLTAEGYCKYCEEVDQDNLSEVKETCMGPEL